MSHFHCFCLSFYEAINVKNLMADSMPPLHYLILQCGSEVLVLNCHYRDFARFLSHHALLLFKFDDRLQFTTTETGGSEYVAILATKISNCQVVVLGCHHLRFNR